MNENGEGFCQGTFFKRDILWEPISIEVKRTRMSEREREGRLTDGGRERDGS
jgi:hypothetical protein